MKKTMSQREVAKFHKYLEKKMSMKDCAKYLQVDMDTLKKFTPSAIEAWKKSQAEKAALALKGEEETRKAAKVVAAAAKEVTKK